jgi:hypothetical protein
MGYYMRNDQFLEKHIGENTVNAYYLYEAARLAGVKRVIFGSSNHVFGFYQKGDPIDSNALYRPDSPYALSKVFVETIGRYYSDRYGISCFNVRIGNFATDGNSQPRDIRASYVWLSNEDCVQLSYKLINAKAANIFRCSGCPHDGCYFDTWIMPSRLCTKVQRPFSREQLRLRRACPRGRQQTRAPDIILSAATTTL